MFTAPGNIEQQTQSNDPVHEPKPKKKKHHKHREPKESEPSEVNGVSTDKPKKKKHKHVDDIIPPEHNVEQQNGTPNQVLDSPKDKSPQQERRDSPNAQRDSPRDSPRDQQPASPKEKKPKKIQIDENLDVHEIHSSGEFSPVDYDDSKKVWCT